MMMENIIQRSINFTVDVVGRDWDMPMKLKEHLLNPTKNSETHNVAWTRSTVRFTCSTVSKNSSWNTLQGKVKS